MLLWLVMRLLWTLGHSRTRLRLRLLARLVRSRLSFVIGRVSRAVLCATRYCRLRLRRFGEGLLVLLRLMFVNKFACFV